MNKTLHSKSFGGHRRADSRAAAGVGGKLSLYSRQSNVTRTSGTSWAKRTTQGHGKCLGRSRVERGLSLFVEVHKESFEKSQFIDREPRKRAGMPIVKAIIMQFTILSHKSSVVKGFLQNNLQFFSF